MATKNEQTLQSLNNKKKELEAKISKGSGGGDDEAVIKDKIGIIDKLIPLFSSKKKPTFPTSEEIQKTFSKVHGFEDKKKEIEQFIAKMKYLSTKGVQGSQAKILCFTGPAGVGKTMFSSKIAESLGKKFYRVSLSGKSDPELLIGHLPSYKAAGSGEIVKGMCETKSSDLVILLDEAEKIGEGDRGNLNDTLLQILDPEQNKDFKDQFLDVGIDLSQITFILTANDEEKLSGPLRSRIKVSELPTTYRSGGF